jgi:hypothetical protein
MTSNLPFHEVSNLFPLVTGREYDALKADIEAHGQREPVWTHKEKIIDGRNRYRACRELSIEPRLREWDGNGSLVAFVLSLNLHRRHLTSSQRAAVATEILPYLEAEARDRQRAAGGDRRKRGKAKASQYSANDEPLPEEVPEAKRDDGEARKQAARLTGTNTRYVTLAKQVKDADPDLFEQVKTGKLKITQASQVVRRREQQEEMKRKAEEAERKRQEGVCGRWPLEIEQNQVSTDFNRLKAEVVARPEFAKRQEKIDYLWQRSEDIEREVQQMFEEQRRIQSEALVAERRLDKDIRRRIEAEHGRVVTGWAGEVQVRTPDTQAELEEAQKEGGELKVRKVLLRKLGRCIRCAAELDERDAVPGEPGMRYIVCDWCRKHADEESSDEEASDAKEKVRV